MKRNRRHWNRASCYGNAAVLVLVASAVSRPAHPCDCNVPGLAQAVAESDSIFAGKAFRVELSETQLSVRFQVDRVWKGPVVSTVDVTTSSNEASCGFPFTAGRRFIVYARFHSSSPPMCEVPYVLLRTGLCTRTRLFDEEEAGQLGAPLWAAPPRAFRRGEVNADGAVDLSDPVAILLHLFQGGAGAECADAMDTNDDGAIDLSDPVFELNYLFLGGPEPPAPGPHLAGFDPTTGDPFACGDATVFPCGDFASTSTLPGVRVEIVDGPCRLTLAEAAAGVEFTYRAVVERAVQGVTSFQLGTCQQPSPGDLLLLPWIRGGGELYCLCDFGLCPRDDHTADLAAGSDAAVFTWCGRNWTGPSDFNKPVGDPFPPGVYVFEVRGEGTWIDASGAEQEFELAASYELELVP